MGWRDILQSSPAEAGKMGKMGNIQDLRPQISHISQISPVQESKTITLEQVLELSCLISEFEERAAIMQYDGEMTREQSEQMAYKEFIDNMKLKGFTLCINKNCCIKDTVNI